MNLKFSKDTEWAETVMLVDAGWIDRFVFDVTVNLERPLNRRLPKADLSRWVDYIALDSGLRPGDNRVQVLMLYEKERAKLENCVPADLKADLDGKAFKDNIGEFAFSSIPVEGDVVNLGTLYGECAEALISEKQVKRLVLVADWERYGLALKSRITRQEGKQVMAFTMQTIAGLHCEQEYLSYSLLATLGVKSEELPQE